ncbi:hypothetical protein ACQ4PT_010731 [Festuca glaucescens]
MASSKLRPAASSSDDLVPVPGSMYEILLRQPAKELCRLRAVCRSWRALTSCPLFIAAHKARHTDPLLAVGCAKENSTSIRFGVVDLSGGNALGRIPKVGGGTVPTSICFARLSRPLGLSILNPATGATLTLPERRSEELLHEMKWGKPSLVEARAVGQVSSTGEYKALRITGLGDEPCSGRQLCEVITFDGTSHGRWRGKQGPPSLLNTSFVIVVGAVVYFLMKFYSLDSGDQLLIAEPSSIASFNLETEEWMGILRGPAPLRKFIQDNKDLNYPGHSLQLSLAELNGCLVTAHNIHGISMDLWFLTNIEEGIWVKRYTLPSQVARIFVCPFLALDDGRILFESGKRTVESYNPRTGTHADVLEALETMP